MRAGATLVELLVVLLLLAIGASVVAPALPQRVETTPDRLETVIAGTRHRAIRDGVLVHATLHMHGDTVHVTASPDGIVLLDSAGVERIRFPGAAIASN